MKIGCLWKNGKNDFFAEYKNSKHRFCKQTATYCRLNSAKSAMSSTIHSGNDEKGVPESKCIGNFTVIAPMVILFVLFFVDVSPEKKKNN